MLSDIDHSFEPIGKDGQVQNIPESDDDPFSLDLRNMAEDVEPYLCDISFFNVVSVLNRA
jgi:hypothetical protein